MGHCRHWGSVRHSLAEMEWNTGDLVMKQTILIVSVLSILLAILFYLGGYILMVGLGGLALSALIFGAFILGAKWAHQLMTDGAKLAIESVSNNDKHDALKIQALADLTREAI